MKQSFIVDQHFTDALGNPEGGQTTAVGLQIAWQRGPLGRPGEQGPPNGAFVETVIAAAHSRLLFYQATRFACEANARAIALLEQAMAELEQRTLDRVNRGVEGTHTV